MLIVLDHAACSVASDNGDGAAAKRIPFGRFCCSQERGTGGKKQCRLNNAVATLGKQMSSQNLKQSK